MFEKVFDNFRVSITVGVFTLHVLLCGLHPLWSLFLFFIVPMPVDLLKNISGALADFLYVINAFRRPLTTTSKSSLDGHRPVLHSLSCKDSTVST